MFPAHYDRIKAMRRSTDCRRLDVTNRIGP